MLYNPPHFLCACGFLVRQYMTSLRSRKSWPVQTYSHTTNTQVR